MVYKLGVILLNYNTASDTLVAIKSIQQNTKLKYKVCVVDNSSNPDKRINKDDVNSSVVDVIYLDENRGYAYGNNIGAKYLLSKYSIENILIMNPDVIVLNNLTIDSLIRKLEQQNENVCGIQPLIWTPRLGNDPRLHTNIRRVMNYWDCCICSFHYLHYLFNNRFRKLVYEDLKPYNSDVFFEVPAGCFFIIKAKVFENVGFFDDRTFLYNEEFILGYKLKKAGYQFLFDVSQKIQHEQGVSTGENKTKITSFLYKCQRQSIDVYLKDYLGSNWIQIKFVNFLIILNYVGKFIKYNFHR